MMNGLGITFAQDGPLSPPAANPAIARLQGRVQQQQQQRRPLPHVPPLRHAISLDGFPMGTIDRQVRIAQDSPEIIHGRPVEEDWGSDDDERYMDDSQEYDSDRSPVSPPFVGLSKSYAHHAVCRQGTEDVRPTHAHPTMQRPHSMMELAHLYSMQALDAEPYDSPDQDGSSMHTTSSRSPAQSSATSVSPSEHGSAKLPASYTNFTAELPSQRVLQERPTLQKRDSRFIEDLTVKPAPSVAPVAQLERQGTLISTDAGPSRKQKELNRLLAPGTGLKRKASTVVLEQAHSKGKARVELDVVLASSLVVEGGVLKGKMEVTIRPNQSDVWVSAPKARVVGFEELAVQETRHVFYHHAAVIESPDEGRLPHTSSSADSEGFFRGLPGTHSFPFTLHLPVGKGAKGPLKSKNGTVQYIVIGSMKLKAKDGSDRSIAHFYRHIDVFPYFNPAVLLAPSLKPHTAEMSKALFMGGNGKVTLTASLHRTNWIAGQRCYVDVTVKNETSKKVKSLCFALVRTMTVFHPSGDSEPAEGEEETCHSETHKKKVAEEVLEMGKRGARGDVTAKGLWVGVDKGEMADFSHSLQVPAESLSITRGRHLEVSYALKVTLGAGPLSSDVSVELPVRVLNFISIDPPPGHVVEADFAKADEPRTTARSWSIDEMRAPVKAATAELGRMASMDSLQLGDLNAMYRSRPLARTESGASSESTASSMMSRPHTLPAAHHHATELVQHAQSRQLKHQMSLECIGNAIASATARRRGQTPVMSSLREEFSPVVDEDVNRALPPLPLNVAAQSVYATPTGIQLDDLDDDAQSDYEEAHDAVEYEDESEDEVEAVMRNFALEAVLARGPQISIVPPTSPHRTVMAPVRSAQKSPPRVGQVVMARRASLATPDSPIKRSPTAPAPVERRPRVASQTTSPKKTPVSPVKTDRITPGVRAKVAIASPSPELNDSDQSSPLTEDARTSPLVAPYRGQQQKRPSQIQSPPRANTSAVAAPGVRKRVDALETRKAALRAVSGRTEARMARQSSISSTASSAFAGVDRQSSTTTFKAPVFSR